MGRRAVDMTGDQARFLRDLLRDITRLFTAKWPGKSERDRAAWMVGVLRKHSGEDVPDCSCWSDVEAIVFSLDSGSARRLIGGLADIRARLDKGLTRGDLKTPPHLLKAIWTAVRDALVDEGDLRARILEVTGGETESTRNLRQGEAAEILRGLGKAVTVYEFREPGPGRRRRVKKTSSRKAASARNAEVKRVVRESRQVDEGGDPDGAA